MKSTLLFFFVLFFVTNLYSQGIDSKKLDNFLDYLEINNAGIGSISIFKNGREIYNRSFGQDKLLNTSYNKDTKYQIASVTKMITAILTFKLIENGQLKLDTKLVDFYPEIPNSDKITIYNLLGHTSGLGNFAIKNGKIWITKKVSEEDILEEIRKQGISFEPNEKVLYSNSAYLLLRKIIEKVHGQEYHRIVEQQITKPLHLKNFASVKSKPTNTFDSYIFDNNWSILNDIEYTNVIGVGDIASTTKDLNSIMDSLFNYKIISKESLKLMQPLVGKENWGRGLATFPFDKNIFIGHSGDVLGAHARLLYNPIDKLSISYATNGERIPTNTFLETIVHILYNESFQLPEIK